MNLMIHSIGLDATEEKDKEIKTSNTVMLHKNATWEIQITCIFT